MKIDLRTENEEFSQYLSLQISKHAEENKPSPGFVHVGFYFDQEGWIFVYFDTRPNAGWDGEWTTHILPEKLLPRPHWHAAAQLENLNELRIIGMDGGELQEWTASPSLQKLANILGELLRKVVCDFESKGMFQPILGTGKLNYCVEELTALYQWPPPDPELVKLAESIRLSCG